MPCASAPNAPCVEVWLIAADDGRAGEGEALLRADDVNDALAVVELAEIVDAELARVLGERRHLQRRFRIVDAVAAVGRRHVVVDHGEGLFRRAHLAAGHAQALEGLRARHLVHEMAVDIEEAGAVRRLMHQVLVPDLVVNGAGFGHVGWVGSLARVSGARAGDLVTKAQQVKAAPPLVPRLHELAQFNYKVYTREFQSEVVAMAPTKARKPENSGNNSAPSVDPAARANTLIYYGALAFIYLACVIFVLAAFRLFQPTVTGGSELRAFYPQLILCGMAVFAGLLGVNLLRSVGLATVVPGPVINPGEWEVISPEVKEGKDEAVSRIHPPKEPHRLHRHLHEARPDRSPTGHHRSDDFLLALVSKGPSISRPRQADARGLYRVLRAETGGRAAGYRRDRRTPLG